MHSQDNQPPTAASNTSTATIGSSYPTAFAGPSTLPLQEPSSFSPPNLEYFDLSPPPFLEGSDPQTYDATEAGRIDAEEDKRRRNTAASARFRIKKKQREQALERTAKEQTERVEQLSKKISQLEMENKLLKDLLIEKSMNSSSSESSSGGK